MDDEDLRVAVYRSLAEEGRVPDAGTLARMAGSDVAGVASGMRRLAAARHVVLDADGTVVLAHPFATRSFGYAVMGARTLWWGGCAWDAFAIPHLLGERDVLVATRCPGCGVALAWVLGPDAPPSGPEVAHFLVPMDRVWDDVVHACGHQRHFCSAACVDRWLRATGNERGAVLDLATLWRLASGWYAGRLDRGYVRREPSAARDYFRAAGLRGPFWGLD